MCEMGQIFTSSLVKSSKTPAFYYVLWEVCGSEAGKGRLTEQIHNTPRSTKRALHNQPQTPTLEIAPVPFDFSCLLLGWIFWVRKGKREK